MIISKTPFRVSFAGGGSDFREYYQNGYGCVVSMAIDKFMYVTVNRTFHEHIRVVYSKVEYAENVDDIEHNLAREALRLVGISEKGIDIVYMGDMLPAQTGSGLGASSSLTTGILNALYAFKGKTVSAQTLAKEACQIEIEMLGRPGGKQDQYAAAFGGLNFIRFNKDESVQVEPINCNQRTIIQLFENLLMFYTGLNTQSDRVLTEQKDNTGNNLRLLDKMVGLAEELRKALVNNDLTDFGAILHEGWVSKQQLANNITNSAINDYYERARKAGAIGGKILGSGGGGFLLLYCERKNHGRVREALSGLREVSFNLEPEGSRIIYISD